MVLDGVQENRYFSYLSSLSEGSSGRIEESETSSRSNRWRSTRGEKIRRKFHRRMEFFLEKWGSCSYDHERIDDIEVPLRYKYIVKQWVPKDLPKINIDFCVNKRIYRIAPSLLHGLGLFSMDGIKFCYYGLTELMEYVGPCCIYKYWIQIVQYTKSMRRDGLAANYIQLKDNDQSKGATLYIDGRPKEMGNIPRFLNSTRPMTTNKRPNCVFEGREGNCVFVCAIKSIVAGEELLIYYNLNRIDTDVAIMGAVRILIYPTCKK
jgi:hypothetical protein